MTMSEAAIDAAADKKFVATVLERLKPVEIFAKWFYVGLAALIVFLGIAVAARGQGGLWKAVGDLLLTWGVSLAVVAASTAVGYLLGFLFGIPRSLQKPNSVQASDPASGGAGNAEPAKTKLAGTRAFISNTSLEEISDWLTKIIIGIGLVQFQTFISYLYKAALIAAAFVASEEISISTDEALLAYNPHFASPFFFALIIAALISGTLFAYLETRTRLTLLFVSAEDATKEPADDELAHAADLPVAVGAPVAPGVQGGPVSPGGGPSPVAAGLWGDRPPNVAIHATPEDKTVAKIPRETLADPKQIVGWASAQARLGNLQIAEDALRDALQKDPENDDIRLRIADVRRLRGNYAGANEITKEALDRTKDPAKRSDLLQRSLYAALYIPPPEGFQQAIQLSDQLLETPEGATASVHLWRAVAYGQKYQWLKQNKGKEEDLTDARRKALEAITKVVELAPNYNSAERTLLRALFDPDSVGRPIDEDDLEVFKDESDFKDIIYRGKP